jgi:hypothetical protein
MNKIVRPALILTLTFLGLALAPAAASAGGLVATKGAVIAGADGFAGVAAPDGTRYFVLPDGLAKLEGERIDAYRSLPDGMGIPAVTVGGDPAGVSADGGTLVLADEDNYYAPRSEMLVLDTRRLQTTESIELDGTFIFDAISPDGSLIYLVHLFDPRNPLDYDVRIYDVKAGKLLAERVVDPSEPDEQMGGFPYARTTSEDGRWAYTLYDGGHEPFIHALDTVGRTAVCVDLEELGIPIGHASTLTLDPEGGGLLIGRRGETLATVDTATWEVALVPAEGEEEDQAAVPASGAAERDPWVLVAGIALIALLVAALLRWSLGPGAGRSRPRSPAS